jgi:hypothetical protein
MATKAKKTTALVRWDEELAKQAEASAKMEESAGGGAFFSLKSGVLSWQDAPLPNNQMAVIILDHVFETTYYAGDYNPENPVGPVAFAFGRDEKTLTWHENSLPEFAGKLCKDSEVCQWGTAEKGRGKAAKETRRLAMIPAGTIDNNGKFKMFDDEDHYESTTIGYMKLPVTSVAGFAGFVKSVAGTLRRPPHGIVAKVKVIPDAKSQFRVLFEPLMNVPNELMGLVMKRRDEAVAAIEFPYQVSEEAEKPAPRGKAAKQPAKKTRKY